MASIGLQRIIVDNHTKYNINGLQYFLLRVLKKTKKSQTARKSELSVTGYPVYVD